MNTKFEPLLERARPGYVEGGNRSKDSVPARRQYMSATLDRRPTPSATGGEFGGTWPRSFAAGWMAVPPEVGALDRRLAGPGIPSSPLNDI